MELEAAAHATPITYFGRKTRKQYVVIAAGGGGVFDGKTSDTVVAFALRDYPGGVSPPEVASRPTETPKEGPCGVINGPESFVEPCSKRNFSGEDR